MPRQLRPSAMLLSRTCHSFPSSFPPWGITLWGLSGHCCLPRTPGVPLFSQHYIPTPVLVPGGDISSHTWAAKDHQENVPGAFQQQTQGPGRGGLTRAAAVDSMHQRQRLRQKAALPQPSPSWHRPASTALVSLSSAGRLPAQGGDGRGAEPPGCRAGQRAWRARGEAVWAKLQKAGLQAKTMAGIPWRVKQLYPDAPSFFHITCFSPLRESIRLTNAAAGSGGRRAGGKPASRSCLVPAREPHQAPLRGRPGVHGTMRLQPGPQLQNRQRGQSCSVHNFWKVWLWRSCSLEAKNEPVLEKNIWCSLAQPRAPRRREGESSQDFCLLFPLHRSQAACRASQKQPFLGLYLRKKRH